MRGHKALDRYWFLALLMATTAAAPSLYAVQLNPGDADTSSSCASLGEYIFVGGTNVARQRHEAFRSKFF